jgi:hypothetical protein
VGSQRFSYDWEWQPVLIPKQLYALLEIQFCSLVYSATTLWDWFSCVSNLHAANRWDNAEARRRGGYAPLEELLPVMRYDFQVVGEMSQQIQMFKALNREVLLLGGTRSPRYRFPPG